MPTATATLLARSKAPGPRWPVLGGLIGPGRDPLGFFSDLVQRYGDVVGFRLGTDRAVLLNDPRDIRDVLVTNHRNFTKSRGLQRAKKLLGEGLLTSEGAAHLRSRRLLQPAFHRERIAGYAATMAEYAEHAQRRWVDGTTLDLSKEMARLTLDIVGKTLFDSDVDADAEVVGKALTDVMASFWVALLPLSDTIDRLPLPVLRRAREARARLDRIIYDLIVARRQSGVDRGDLLSMLLMARDAEGDGGGFDDQQARDEAMTLFLAGHETTANALSWTWYLLSQHPDVEQRLHEEVDRVLEGRLPTAADVPQLVLTEAIITEAMRLYPPAWIIGRRAIEAFRAGGFDFGPGTLVFMSPYVLHRDPRHFPDPARFLPDRWTVAFKTSLPKLTYFPFGGGPRQCIGESFAKMELVLVVATLARRWRFRVTAGHRVDPLPLVTLRPRSGLPVLASRRASRPPSSGSP